MSLQLYDFNCPDGAWSYMFSAAHMLPHLTLLKLMGDDEVESGAASPSPSWSAVDVSSLVSCCPGLREIWGIALQHGRHVSELHKLTALERLDVHFDEADLATVEESMKGLSAVTQLWLLCVSVDGQDLELSALLPLTQLTNLNRFTLNTRFLDADEDCDLRHMELGSTSQVRQGFMQVGWCCAMGCVGYCGHSSQHRSNKVYVVCGQAEQHWCAFSWVWYCLWQLLLPARCRGFVQRMIIQQCGWRSAQAYVLSLYPWCADSCPFCFCMCRRLALRLMCGCSCWSDVVQSPTASP